MQTTILSLMNRTGSSLLLRCKTRWHLVSIICSCQSTANTPFQKRAFAKKAHQGPKHKVAPTKPKGKSSGAKMRVPAMLSSTASPYVFVSKTALDETIDPSLLFSDGQTIPPMLSNGSFQYLSPKKDLNFQFPSHGIPEVAFLGRSNVGKSSIINSLMRRNLCITSKHPGRTQLPYFYSLYANGVEQVPSNASGLIIDLPGYGYAAAPKETAETWQEYTQDLLLDRRDKGVLKRLFLLIDARRDDFTEIDRTVLTWLEDAHIPHSVVLTKIDRTSRPLVLKLVNELCLRYASQSALEGQDGFAFQSPIIHTTSSKRKWGIHELMLSLEAEFSQDELD